MADLFGDLDRRGFPANLLELFYYGAAMSARYDEHGHILPSRVLDLPELRRLRHDPGAGLRGAAGRLGRACAPGPAAQAARGAPPGAGQARARAQGALRPARPRAAAARAGAEAPPPAPVPLPVEPPEQLPDELEDLLEYLLR